MHTGSPVNKPFQKIWQNSQKNTIEFFLVMLQACAYNFTKERFYRWCLTEFSETFSKQLLYSLKTFIGDNP